MFFGTLISNQFTDNTKKNMATSFPFLWYHRELKAMNKLVRSKLPNPSQRIDLDSSMKAEQVRRNLNSLLRFLPEGSRGLEVGCGRGHTSALLQSLGYPMDALDLPNTIDESLGLTKRFWQKPVWQALAAAYGPRYRLADARNIPFNNNTFDFVVAYAVIEHIRPTHEVRHFLQEIHRVLKPGGFLLISETPRPQSYTEWLGGVLGWGNHEVTFASKQVAQAAREAHLAMVTQFTYDLLPVQIPTRLGLTIINALFPMLLIIEKLLTYTPVKYFAHHTTTIVQKSS